MNALIFIAIAALLGAAMWWAVPAAIVPVPAWGWIVIAGIAVICLIPAVGKRLIASLDRCADLPIPDRRRVACLIAIICSFYLTFTAWRQDRDFFPKTLDDQSYVIQMRMLAHGRLWMPQHDCADFFDTFHVLSKPKYASAYFPGTALMYVPLVWLGLPMWIGPLISSGAVVALLYWITTEMVDGVAGLLAATVMLSSNWFRMLSIVIYGQTPALLLGLLMFWAWLKWREKPIAKWSILIGVFFGALAITRPADALCYAVAMVLTTIFHRFLQTDGHGFKTHVVKIGFCAVGALPFLAIQAIQNVGITGSLLRTPFSLYLDRDQPGANFGFHAYDPSRKPESVIPQKQVYYQQFIVPFIQKHTLGQAGAWLKEHLPQIADVTLPARVMLLFVPIGLLGLHRDQRRWALAITFPLFLLIYFAYPPFVEHYAVPFAPAVVVLVAMAPGVLRASIPKIGNAIYLASVFVILIVSISMLPEFNSKVDDETFHSPMMRVLHDKVDNSDLAPAVILFRYHPELPQTADNSCKIEPVYNTGVAWPDDAPIIRAHDLGSRNTEIIRYYAERQPQRTFYIFDRGNLADPLHRLGTAGELATDGYK